MGFYSDLSNTAAGLLSLKGQLLTFSRETTGSYDPKSGETQSSASTYTGNGGVFNYKSNQVDGTVIQSGDLRVILEATTTAPKLSDKVTIDGGTYKIVNIETVSPAGVPVIYKLQLRK